MMLEVSLDSFALQETEKLLTIAMNGVAMEDDLITQIPLILEETCLDSWSGLVTTVIYDKAMAVTITAELRKDSYAMEEQL